MKKILLISLAFILLANAQTIRDVSKHNFKYKVQNPSRLNQIPALSECRGLLNNKIDKKSIIYFLPSLIATDTLRRTYDWDAKGNLSNSLIESNSNGVWTNKEKDIFTYNSSGSMLTELHQKWSNGAWVNETRSTYTYSNNPMQVSQIVDEKWQNNAWLNEQRYTFTWENNFMTVYVSEMWQNNAWLNSYKSTSTYSNGNVIMDISQYWSNNAWVNQWKTTYTYNTNNKMTLELFQNWQDNSWFNDMQFIHSYDVNGYPSEILMQMWMTGNVWENSNKQTLVYNSSGWELSGITYFWNNNTWENGHRLTKTYDATGNMLTHIEEYWTTEWTNNSKEVYQYDAHNNATHGEYFSWQNGAWTSVQGPLYVNFNNMNFREYTYGKFFDADYLQFTGVYDDIYVNSFELSQNYPNPFNPATTINYSVAKEGTVRLNIYDALGSKVASLVNEYKPAGKYSIQFSGNDLSSGIYLYRLESNGLSLAKKLVLIK